ncbi:S8 family serine peptidase [Streptosporangium sandarakinum]|uniref:S8 family serine peptidase n=1 Tax=Streptosporangium sandarakinum TaxID=1260955 RepID=UPI0036AF2514
MTTLSLPKSGAAQAWKDMTGGARTLAAGTAKIWLDGRLSYTLDRSTEQIGATEAWKQGMTGEGVTVAVLDSGYDPDHPDLKGVVTQTRNLSEEPDIRDNLGHGTHVASTVAGNGEKYRGVAPGARLAVGKVGGAAGASESAVVAGMEWAALEAKAKIVNFSMAAPDEPGIDPVEQAVNTLSAKAGTLFVVGAGNSGRSPVSSPAGADAALTVGAVDRRDRMAAFSSTGPRAGDHAVKPDITAPGAGIDATGRAPGDYAGTVTATAGDTVIRTVAGAYVEPESYDVTITVVGRQGQPADPWMAQIYDPATGSVIEPVFHDGTATVRLPKGDWGVYTEAVEKIDGKRADTAADSPFRVDGDGGRLTVDMRQGRETGVTLDDPSAQIRRGFEFGLAHGAWSFNMITSLNPNAEFFVVPVLRPGLTYTLRTMWLSRDVSPSPYVYDLVDRRTDGIPDDPTYRARRKELAKISTTYRASGVAATGMPLAGTLFPEFPGSSLTPLVYDLPLPGTLVRYRTPRGDLRERPPGRHLPDLRRRSAREARGERGGLERGGHRPVVPAAGRQPYRRRADLLGSRPVRRRGPGQNGLGRLRHRRRRPHPGRQDAGPRRPRRL